MENENQIIWVTADYKKIKVADMTTKHLVNTINLLSRHPELMNEILLHNTSIDVNQWRKILKNELKRRNDEKKV